MKMKIKCTHCNNISNANDWNTMTEKYCGKGSKPIEEGLESSNWYYICPYCYEKCYKDDRIKI
jgi:hypothetical protein